MPKKKSVGLLPRTRRECEQLLTSFHSCIKVYVYINVSIDEIVLLLLLNNNEEKIIAKRLSSLLKENSYC